MLPHPRFLLALIGVAVTCGCAAPAPQPSKMMLPPSASGSHGAHRSVSLTRAAIAHHSEQAPVTEDKPDPEAQRLFQARMAQPAIPLVVAPAPPKVTAIALDDTRRGEAPGMQPAGEIFIATLTEGQRATLAIKILPGECETFIAQGGLGVIEVDLFLTAGDGASGRLLAEDPATGPIAVIGGHGQCIAGAPGTGTAAVLHAAVRRGAGAVLVRAYRK